VGNELNIQNADDDGVIEGLDLSDPWVAENLRRMPKDRELDARERNLLKQGKMLDGRGNGSWPSFADLPVETLRLYQQIGQQRQKQNIEAKRLMERAAYLEKHKEHASTILGGKLSIIEGLLKEMVDPETGLPDTSRLDDKRLKVLQSALNDWEKAGGMQPAKESEAQSVNVNVTHTVSKILDRLGSG